MRTSRENVRPVTEKYAPQKLGYTYFGVFLIPDDESGEKTVSVLLAGEESELTFIDHSCAEMTVSDVFIDRQYAIGNFVDKMSLKITFIPAPLIVLRNIYAD